MVQKNLVLFVCLHGSAKSVVAMEYFNRFAAERGVPLRALSAGTEPDEVMPPEVTAGLAADGFDLDGKRPLGLTEALLAEAAPRPLRLWAHGDLPGAGALARRASFERIRALWTMQRSLHPPLDAPRFPHGITLRTFSVGRGLGVQKGQSPLVGPRMKSLMPVIVRRDCM